MDNIKYNININQIAFHKHFPELDLKDSAIFDYLRSFINSKIGNVSIYYGEQYTWISYSYILKQMPLLSFKSKKSLSRRMKSLEKYKLIKMIVSKTDGNKTYFALGENVRLLEFQYTPPIDKNVYSLSTKMSTYNNINNNKDILKNIKGNQNDCTDLQIKYNKIITRTLINIAGFNTRINKNTKTMQTVYKYLNQLQHKQFLPNKEFNAKALTTLNIKKDCFRIDRVMNEKQLELILTRTCKEWRRMQNSPNCWKPEKAPSLDAFFYNPRTGMSWFLYCFCGLVSDTKEVKTKEMLENVIKSAEKIDPNFMEYTEYLYNQNMQRYKKWDDSEKLAFFSTCKGLLKWRTDNSAELKSINSGYDPHMGNNKCMFKTISKFLEETFPNPFPKFLIPNGTNWHLFGKFCLSSYNSRIDVDN